MLVTCSVAHTEEYKLCLHVRKKEQCYEYVQVRNGELCP